MRPPFVRYGALFRLAGRPLLHVQIELRDRTFENQQHRASGLTLVTAAVTLWNTVYIGQAIDHLRGTGLDVPDTLLTHVAPLGWEHIGLTGDYLWSEIDRPRERFRPLRLSPADRRT